MFQSRVQSRKLLDITLRDPSASTSSQQKESSPKQQIIPLKLANILGLNQILLNNIVFKRSSQSYCIRKVHNTNIIISNESYSLAQQLVTQIQILQLDDRNRRKHSIPVCRIKPTQIQSNNVIIYAHGNASDLVQTIKYVQKMCAQLCMEFVVFDYTGYGCSAIKQCSQESIRQDLQIVLAWVTGKVPMKRVILWGFSLGTYPVTYCASKYQVKGVILQAPMASVGCTFKQKQIDPEIQIHNDYLVNLDYIHKIKSQLFIVHSKVDKTIPFSHSLALAKKYSKYNGVDKLQFLQVDCLEHNQMHSFFVSKQDNPLKYQLISFLKRLQSQPFLSSNQNNLHNILSQSNVSIKFLSTSQVSKDPKIKVTANVNHSKIENFHKKQYIDKLRDSIKLAPIPPYNQKQAELEIQNGVIIRRFTPKADCCFCLQNC